MKHLILLISFSIAGWQTEAKVWRVNNTPGVAADFSSCADALASASVVNGDTLHIEGSATTYTGFTLNKRLTIIGPGYFLSGTNSNTGLQANPNTATFNGGIIMFDSTASGSVLMGLDNFFFAIGGNLGSATDNITITRCNINNISQYYTYTAGTVMSGWKVNKCHILSYIDLSSMVVQNWEITNNIFQGSISLGNTGNLNNLVRNNVFRSIVILFSTYFSNNIITGTTFTTTNVTIKNNLSTGTNLPAGNGNLNNQTDAALFQGLTGNSTDGQWRLNTGSNAIGAGETIAGITPDCGAYGTADPYKLSGIPAVPTVYLLTVPASVPSNATSMPITISTKSNN
jgi:hypothetical protein